MGKVKDIPCKGCPRVEQCKEYFQERLDKYDPDRDAGEDYNSETIYGLYDICVGMRKYLFLGEVSFPSRSFHFFWWEPMKHKISENAWITRLNMVRDFWSEYDTDSL